MKSALQRRAEVELLHLIEVERGRRSAPRRPPWQRALLSYLHSDEAEERERESFRFSVEALAAIGALPEAETEDWMARLESKANARDPRPKVTPYPEAERRARALLEDRLPPRGLDWESSEYKRALWRFQEAQAVINITGALSQEERAQWHERFLERVSPEDRSKLHKAPQCGGVDLERVVTGPAIRHAGIRITHVELYSDGLIVHWHHSVEYPGGRKPEGWEDFRTELPSERSLMLELVDDVGTSYQWWPGPSHDRASRKTGFVHWLTATFTPAVPKEATRLLASREGHTFDIPLTS